MNIRHNDWLPYVVSAGAGLAICLAITVLSGRREAWDSGYYFVIGIPLMCVVIFAISTRYPRGAWRWALAMAVGQSVAMVLGGGSASLWPLAIIAMILLSIPQIVTALMAEKRAAKRDAFDPGK